MISLRKYSATASEARKERPIKIGINNLTVTRRDNMTAPKHRDYMKKPEISRDRVLTEDEAAKERFFKGGGKIEVLACTLDKYENDRAPRMGEPTRYM